MKTQPASHSVLTILTLVLTIIIDIMGLGLIFPLLSTLFLGKDALLVHGAVDLATRHWMYALVVAVWPLGIFLGAPYFGKLSDKYGRKRLLQGCLVGTAAAYVLSAVGVVLHSYTIFLMSRFISGYFAGSFEIAQAAITDISTPANKVRNLAFITFSATAGIMVGPALTGLTAGWQILSWPYVTTPLLVAAALSLLNVLSVSVLFKETYHNRLNIKVPLTAALTSCLVLFQDKRVRRLGGTFFFQQLGYGFYMMALPIILAQLFHWSVRLQGWFFSSAGLCMVLAMILIQPILLKRFTMRSNYLVLVTVEALLFVVLVIWPDPTNQWWIFDSTAVVQLIGYSCLLGMMSNAVSEHEQGAILGGAGSAYGISQIITGLAIGPLLTISLRLPLILVAICVFISVLIMFSIRQPSRNE